LVKIMMSFIDYRLRYDFFSLKKVFLIKIDVFFILALMSIRHFSI
jgi:uncharacterized membrane protein